MQTGRPGIVALKKVSGVTTLTALSDAGEGLFGEFRAVVVLPRNRPKDAAVPGLAAVDHDRPERTHGLAGGNGGGLQLPAHGLS